MKIGYCRVSTTDQDLDAQRQQLQQAGVKRENIYHDTMSGARDDRPQLAAALRAARPGDTLVIPAFDRLGRSLVHLVTTVDELQKRAVHVVSLRERIDTTTAAGKLSFQVFAALAEFERALIRERTKAGLAAKKAQGVRLGAPKKLTAKEVRRARTLLRQGQLSTREVAATVGVSKATLFRYFPGGRAGIAEKT